MTGTIENLTSRMTGEERRAQILQTAIKLFSENGFRGTTTKKIAKKAGISEAMVFRHFRNKEELYHAILDEKSCGPLFKDPFEKLQKAIDDRDDFGVFYALALNALQNHRNDTDFVRLMMYSALEGHDLAISFIESSINEIYEHVGGYIKLRQKEGAFRELKPRVVVRAFSGMFVHHSINNLVFDTDQKILKISDEEAATEFAKILLNGIKK